MKRSEILRKLIDETGMSIKTFAEHVGIPYTTLYSILERGVGRASIDNVLKICKALGITAEQLDSMAKGDNYEIKTIAAHHDGEDWTEEELETIEQFKEFVRSQRSKQE